MTGQLQRGAGDGLLSRGLSTGVPSALSGLTTVFGMGTGVAPTLESPAKLKTNGEANGRSWAEKLEEWRCIACSARVRNSWELVCFVLQMGVVKPHGRLGPVRLERLAPRPRLA